MKYKSFFLILVIMSFYGCAAKLPVQYQVNPNYSINNIKTYSVSTDCSKTKISGVQQNFSENFCPVLESNIKIFLQQRHADWSYSKNNPGLIIEATLEQIHSGSAALRFWVGFGAGRSVISVKVRILKNNTVVATRMFNETTTMPDLVNGTWSNEDVILRDASLIAKKIVEFVQNPSGYEKRNHPAASSGVSPQ